MTYRVGPKGQVVIPKTFRDALGLQPGTEVAFVLEDQSVRMFTRPAAAGLGGRFRDSGISLADGLLEDRAREPR